MTGGREPLQFNTRRRAQPAPTPVDPEPAVGPQDPAPRQPVSAPAQSPPSSAKASQQVPAPAEAPSSLVAESTAAGGEVIAVAPAIPAPVVASPRSGSSQAPDPGADDEVDLTDSVVRPVSVYMPRSTYEALRDTARNREMDYTSLVIEALNEHSAAVAPQFRTVGSVSGRTMPVRASRRRRGEGLEHIQLRLDGLQRQWLAARVEESGAPSRAAFVTAVLNRHLGVTIR